MPGRFWRTDGVSVSRNDLIQNILYICIRYKLNSHNIDCRDPTNSKQWILAGVVSFGVGCARPGQVGAYTRVTYHLEWIYQTMSKPNLILISISIINILIYLLETSKLPQIVPKQGCSGMICRLGTGICLDQNSICDDKVDCLNAEDEVGCPRTAIA